MVWSVKPKRDSPQLCERAFCPWLYFGQDDTRFRGLMETCSTFSFTRCKWNVEWDSPIQKDERCQGASWHVIFTSCVIGMSHYWEGLSCYQEVMITHKAFLHIFHPIQMRAEIVLLKISCQTIFVHFEMNSKFWTVSDYSKTILKLVMMVYNMREEIVCWSGYFIKLKMNSEIQSCFRIFQNDSKKFQTCFVLVICWSKFYKVKANFWQRSEARRRRLGPTGAARVESHHILIVVTAYGSRGGITTQAATTKYESLSSPIYTPCKPPSIVESHHKITHDVC
jgi:hypothetical protein